jgi:hypothetical protein
MSIRGDGNSFIGLNVAQDETKTKRVRCRWPLHAESAPSALPCVRPPTSGRCTPTAGCRRHLTAQAVRD